jgi:spermine oxidase
LAAATAAGLMKTRPRPQKWWGSTFILPGRKDGLTKEENILVHKAIEAYAAAIESIETSEEGSANKNEDGGSRGKGKVVHAVVGDVLDVAWHTFLQDQNLNTTDTTNSSASIELARAAWQWREQLQRAIDGCDTTNDVEATARSLYTEFGESEIHAPIPCGYQKLAESLAISSSSQLPSSGQRPLNIKLNHEVELIEWGDDTSEDSSVSITCTNGARFQASAVIFTASLGVLKQRHQEMFIPNLPERKVQAINNLKIGVVDKIIIDFSSYSLELDLEEQDNLDLSELKEKTSDQSSGDCDTKNFFESYYLDADRDVVTYALLWEDEDIDNGTAEGLPEWAKGIFSIRWGGPEFKRKRNILGKNEEEEEEEDSKEDDESSSGTGLSPKYFQAVMWLTGDAARSMEAASEPQVLDTIKTIFKLFPAIALPLEETGVEDKDVLWHRARVIRSQWGLNPFTSGSYSYVGPQGTVEDVAALAAPIFSSGSSGRDSGEERRPVLLFAGEACHVQYIGTTHAAFLTGTEAAELLLNADLHIIVP